MRLAKHKRPTMALMDMTPMIDVVFQLLIFFMLSNQVSELSKEQLELPKLAGAVDQELSELVINIDHEGKIIVDGVSRSLGELAGLVGAQLERRAGNANLVRVNLRVDYRAECRHPNQVVRTLEDLGVKQVRMGVDAE